MHLLQTFTLTLFTSVAFGQESKAIDGRDYLTRIADGISQVTLENAAKFSVARFANFQKIVYSEMSSALPHTSPYLGLTSFGTHYIADINFQLESAIVPFIDSSNDNNAGKALFCYEGNSKVILIQRFIESGFRDFAAIPFSSLGNSETRIKIVQQIMTPHYDALALAEVISVMPVFKSETNELIFLIATRRHQKNSLACIYFDFANSAIYYTKPNIWQ